MKILQLKYDLNVSGRQNSNTKSNEDCLRWYIVLCKYIGSECKSDEYDKMGLLVAFYSQVTLLLVYSTAGWRKRDRKQKGREV